MAEQGAEVEAISEAPSPVKRDRGGRYSADRSAVCDHFTSGSGGTNSCTYVRQCGQVNQWHIRLAEFGLRLSLKKTEYLECGDQTDGTIAIAGTPINKVEGFRYLGSRVTSD